MSSYFSASIARMPNMLLSQLSGSALARTNISIARLQEQIATGKAINRPSDDAVRAATVAQINERLERDAQVERNLQHADGALTGADEALGAAYDLLLEAKGLASSQLNVTTTAGERRDQAQVVDSMLRGLLSVANRKSLAGHIFAGSTPQRQPIEDFLGGFRYTAQGPGLHTDLGPNTAIPVTLGGSVLGSVSSRLAGTVDLDPDLTLNTPIENLRGARGLGVSLGTIEFSYNGGDPVSVDLAGADSVGDVVDAINAALTRFEADSGTAILGSNRVGLSGESIAVDLLAGASAPPNATLEFVDPGDGTTALDLGLRTETPPPMSITASSAAGLALSPRLDATTPVSALKALIQPLGEILLHNTGQSRRVDLSGAQTAGEIASIIQGAGLGIRVEIDSTLDRLNIVNEVAAGTGLGMSIEEVSGNNLTASQLGIRSLDRATRIADFNDGRGVEVRTGSTDPITGDPDPSRDVDFLIRLGDGTELTIDLAPSDLTTVGAVIDAIGTQASDQLIAQGLSPGLLTVGLSDSGNGIALSQDTSDPTITGPLAIEARNGSAAAEQLGLLDGTYDASSATIAGSDRATVRVHNAFTALVDLRDALRNDDTVGITIASGRVDEMLSRVAETRALVGGFGQRITNEQTALEDRRLLDQTIQSQLQDLDFVEAASQFSLLQTQLQAGYQSAATLNQLSLLDFLG